MNKRTVTIALFAGLSFLGGLLALVGCLYFIHHISTELDERRLEAATQEAHREGLKLLSRLVDESTEERATLSSYIIPDDEVIDFLSLLRRLGEEQGVELTTESLNVVTDKTQFEKLSVTVLVKGSYGGVVQMLKILETLPYQSSVVEVSLNMEGVSGQWMGKFRVQVTKQKAL